MVRRALAIQEAKGIRLQEKLHRGVKIDLHMETTRMVFGKVRAIAGREKVVDALQEVVWCGGCRLVTCLEATDGIGVAAKRAAG